MIAANYSEFRLGLKKYLDAAENDNELVIIKRSTGKGAVLISLEEYNSLKETMHLLSSKANTKWLYDSIEQAKNGDFAKGKLID